MRHLLPLALEFVKALASPSAAIIVAIYVASRTLKAFKAQKGIDLRVDWHRRIHAQIALTALAISKAGPYSTMAYPEARVDAEKASTELLNLANEAWLFATQSEFEAASQLINAMTKVVISVRGSPSTTEDLHAALQSCFACSRALTRGLRSELNLSQLTTANSPVPGVSP